MPPPDDAPPTYPLNKIFQPRRSWNTFLFTLSTLTHSVDRGNVRNLFERSEFLIPTWVTSQYSATSKKKNLRVCSTNLGFSGGSANRYCCRTLRQYDARYQVRIMYQIRMYLVSGGINLNVRTLCFCFCFPFSTARKSPTGSLPPAVPLAIKRTFRPWTHTSDDSYIYQLSLVVATATLYLFKAGPVHGKFAREDDVVFGKPVTKKFRPGVVYSRSSLIFLCVPPHETRDEHRV